MSVSIVAMITQGDPTPQLIARRGGCGSRSAADFRSYDFPTLSVTDTMKVAAARLMTDGQLETVFRAELTAFGTGALGASFVTRFIAGTGGKWTHGVGSTIATLAARAGAFQSAVRNVANQINMQVRGQFVHGALHTFTLSGITAPGISFRPFDPFTDGMTMKALIGGTQGLQIMMWNFAVVPGTFNYNAMLRFVMCDNFGVDESDLYSPALIAFWVLQHERPGHRPFVNEIIVDVAIRGNFSMAGATMAPPRQRP